MAKNMTRRAFPRGGVRTSLPVTIYRRKASNEFSPADIAGLSLWLDAADSSTITKDTGVSQWKDKSTTGSLWAPASGNTQPDTGTQTINGKNVIVFNGTNTSLSAVNPLATSMPLSIFIVQRIVAKTSFGMTYATSTSSDAFNIRQNGSTGDLAVVANNVGVINLTTSDRTGTTDLLSWVVPSSGDSVFRRNGTSLTLSNATAKPVLTGTHYLGRRSDGFYLNGWIAEIIAYSAELNADNRLSVERYLSQKWGISLA
jgi:hypothetical protein